MTTPLSMLRENGVRISGLTSDSRKVSKGDLFVAYAGESNDGRAFIQQAITQGASAVAWEADGFAWNADWQVLNIPVPGLRKLAGNIADEFYAHPSKKLWMIGVTGTNGKTSCTHWLAQALNALGRKTAVVGTLGNGFPGALSAAINTTPDPIVLHGMLADYLDEAANAVAMEVSSHGLDQGRLNGVHFNLAVLTNLSRDHLDYHGDMAAYADAKRKLFDWDGLECAVLNLDDPFGEAISVSLRTAGKKVLTYGLVEGDVRGSRLHFDSQGLFMTVETPWGNAEIQAAVVGRFNAYNVLAVLASLLASNVKLADAVNAIKHIQPVAGRMQRYGGGHKPLVVIDYAHTPDALEKALSALRGQTTAKLICVFGCGGNRDQGKRPLMGEVASRLADEVIVTTDNPRDEDPAEIIKAIVAGISSAYQVETHREIAIHNAIAQAHTGDVVLVAGKGHEDYQEIAGIKYPFSDEAVVRLALAQYESREGANT
ncbi:MAG: UDP-N-acetylmuramoyl-L-alanyl-D-glutamate--2,6-diaminopimelate ligase [Methylophilaceae bacterium]|nr:UDP-N-acetylmuramoyl-L-alanyl-D-glutamate--2,6-diaminopimelate ligase [Methyloradius sp.]